MSEQPHRASPEELLTTLSQLTARARQREEVVLRRRNHLVWVGILGGVAIALGLLGFNVALWDGRLHVPFFSTASTTRHEPSASVPAPAPAPSSTETRPSGPPAELPATTAQPPALTTAPTTTSPPAPSPVGAVTLRITGARGDSWVEVRRRDRTGDMVYAGIVTKGASVTVKGKQLWVRFGAVGNLDLVLNGKPVHPTHTGTVDAVVTPNGLGA